ncbi:MAG TPA: hypothetical protein VH333_18655 [Pseudonocardiaceae bacterium]|jgi:predicted class III extradiol MEMO1 family dioxygenase|nr:hypothetical protein [Pseudonocardiaceae bacterium]
MEYDDGRIRCDGRGLVIRWYTPLGRKQIDYGRIKKVVRTSNRWGRGRIWGSSDLRHWYNLDRTRPTKDTALVLDLGRRTQPVITPDNPDQVVAVLRKHGVDVSGGA